MITGTFESTIVAQATIRGNGPIAIIRVSGPSSLKILKEITGKRTVREREMYYKTIYRGKKIIDEVQFVYYSGPKSYSGEDSFEMFCHGNQIVVNDLIEMVKSKGARLAGPGEFTKRAFLNGKMDLCQAEGVCALISSGNRLALEAAKKTREGRLSEEIGELRERIIEMLVKVELEIDFAGENIEIYATSEVLSNLGEIEKKIGRLLEVFAVGKKIRRGFRVCICGEVNVGKSTIINGLANRECAIVSETPGTTRDVICEVIDVSGREVVVFDTAGIRESGGEVEKEGVRRAKETVMDADLIIFVIEAGKDSTEEAWRNIEGFDKKKAIAAINKIDRNPEAEGRKIEGFWKTVAICAIENRLDVLKKGIMEFINEGMRLENLCAINERQYFALKEAGEYVKNAKKKVKYADLLSYELKMVIESLENLLGRVTNEEILERVFSNFCIGK